MNATSKSTCCCHVLCFAMRYQQQQRCLESWVCVCFPIIFYCVPFTPYNFCRVCGANDTTQNPIYQFHSGRMFRRLKSRCISFFLLLVIEDLEKENERQLRTHNGAFKKKLPKICDHTQHNRICSNNKNPGLSEDGALQFNDSIECAVNFVTTCFANRFSP